MDQPDMPVVRFYRLIDEARFPQRADRSAAGTLPTRAYRYCQPATSAAGFGWWVFPPADLQFLWDGHDIFWQRTGGADWLPLAPSAQFPDFAARFDATAPKSVAGCSPPFLTALPESGTLQIWTGLIARTAMDWSLLIRAPANLPSRGATGCMRASLKPTAGSVHCSPICASPAHIRRYGSRPTFRSRRFNHCRAKHTPRQPWALVPIFPIWVDFLRPTGTPIGTPLRCPTIIPIEPLAPMR